MVVMLVRRTLFVSAQFCRTRCRARGNVIFTMALINAFCVIDLFKPAGWSTQLECIDRTCFQPGSDVFGEVFTFSSISRCLGKKAVTRLVNPTTGQLLIIVRRSDGRSEVDLDRLKLRARLHVAAASLQSAGTGGVLAGWHNLRLCIGREKYPGRIERLVSWEGQLPRVVRSSW